MQLLHNLLQFLLEQMNYNIDFIYNKYGDEFKQSSAEFDEQGETPRQFEIYKKYEEIIESDLLQFCKMNKYTRVQDLILDIQHILDTSTKDDIIEELELLEDDNDIFSILKPSPDDIVNIIVDLSSYTTFSTIIRNRCSCNGDSSDGDSSDGDDGYEESDEDESTESTESESKDYCMSNNNPKINNYTSD